MHYKRRSATKTLPRATISAQGSTTIAPKNTHTKNGSTNNISTKIRHNKNIGATNIAACQTIGSNFRVLLLEEPPPYPI